jgi:ABC-type nickel/cobalt efflux system permease component RcnA
VIIIAVMITLTTGILPSFILSDWVWFSRSGSLLLIFGIYIIWQNYQGKNNKALDNVLDSFDNYLEQNTKAEENRVQIKKEVSDQFDKVRVATEKTFQNIEFFLVTLGTLIWAYGDLFNKLYPAVCST